MQVVVALAGLVAFATVLGMLWRVTQGRVRTASGSITGVELGGRATLLQLSTEVCAPCRATAKVLHEIADEQIRHVELDIADRPDLVSRFNVLQTPTTLILDRDGVVRARIGGAVRRDLIVAELERVA
jgi:thiol-disulfide isomerase/thioredoxin